MTESIGWATSRAVYLGRTQYTVLMYDSFSKDKIPKPWNVTFFDYSSLTMTPEISDKYGKLVQIRNILFKLLCFFSRQYYNEYTDKNSFLCV